MKHRKIQFWLPAILLAATFIASPLKAQVTIGDDAVPRPGLALDMKKTTSAGYVGGLMPPNVAILSLTAIPASFTDTGYNSTDLAGMIVYNTNAALTGGLGIYMWDGTQWKPLSSSGGGSSTTDMYGADGSLTGNRTVNQGNYNLIFQNTGGAKTIIDGNFQMNGAVYAHIRIYDGATNIDWQADDYIVTITNPNLASNALLSLPDPVANKGRFLCINNNTGGTCLPAPSAKVGGIGVGWPFNFAGLAAGSGAMFISDGIQWWAAPAR